MNLYTKIHRHHDGNGSLTFERVQDCNAIADFCKEQRAIGNVGSNEMRHAAKIPLIMIEAYINTKNITPHEFYANRVHMEAILNDPAMADFRIWQGKI